MVFREGEKANELHILHEGTVALDIDVPVMPGGPAVPTAVDMVGPADCVGWSSFLEPRTYRATARCVTPAKGIVISVEALREIMDQDVELGYEVMTRLVQTVADYLGHTRLRLTTQVVRLLDRQEW